MDTGPVAPSKRQGEAPLTQVMTELLGGGSLEMGPDDFAQVHEIAALLPAGMRVYVNHPPRHALAQSHRTLKALRAAGLEPVAHVAARRLSSRAELESFLERAREEASLSKVLLLGGDAPQPLGPYASGMEVLRDADLRAHGIREVGLPAYPDGHPRIPRAALEQALSEKLALIAGQGASAFLVTQFSFAPARVVECCAELSRKSAATPVYVGLPGPTDARTLLRFARVCGVSASLRALQDQGMGAIRLLTHTDPRKQLAVIAQYRSGRESCNVVGAHLYSFGGVTKTAAWMDQAIHHPAGA